MLGLARRVGARLLLASTSEVYGDPEVHPQPESYKGSVNTIGIRSCYDEGKRIAETLCFDYRRMHGTEIRVARIFNTYGPRQSNRAVIPQIITQIAKKKKKLKLGSLLPTRDFNFVKDTCEAFIATANSTKTIGVL